MHFCCLLQRAPSRLNVTLIGRAMPPARVEIVGDMANLEKMGSIG